MMDNIIDNKLGKSFPPAMSFAGYIFIAIGLIFIFVSHPILSLVLILFGSLIGVTIEGIQINIEKQLFRNYTGFFGLKIGKWKPYINYPDIAIIKEELSTTAYSMSNRAAKTGSNIYYSIVLLSKNHREKVIIMRSKDIDQARINIKELAEKLHKELAVYSPAISKRANARRRK